MNKPTLPLALVLSAGGFQSEDVEASQKRLLSEITEKLKDLPKTEIERRLHWINRPGLAEQVYLNRGIDSLNYFTCYRVVLQELNKRTL